MSESSDANRGRTGSRGQGGFRGMSRGRWNTPKFFSSDRQQQAEDKLEQTKEEVKKDLDAAKAPDVIKKKWRNKAKVDKVVEVGKNFASKFFLGFQEKQRGNVKIDIKPDLDQRIAAGYAPRLRIMANKLKTNDPDREYLFHRFTGIVDIGIALKLYKSATVSDQVHLGNIHSLHKTQLKLPKKMIVLIDQLGKTDITGDFRLRIRNQHLYVKSYLLMGIMRYFSYEHSDGREMVSLKAPWDIEKVVQLFADKEKSQLLYDSQSLDIIKKRAEEHFRNTANDTTYDFNTGTAILKVRMPPFKFSEKVKPSDVCTYLANPLFKDVKAEDGMGKLISALVVSTAQISWLRNKRKKLKELNTAYDKTFLADVSFVDVLSWMNMTDIGDIIDDADLDTAVSTAVQHYENGFLQTLMPMINFEDVNFADHGSPAQMIEVDGNSFDEIENDWGVAYQALNARPVANCKLKISEHDAIMGVMVGYGQKLQLSTGHLLSYDSNVVNMMTEFTSSDFKA